MSHRTPAAPILTWSRDFPATPDQASGARQFLNVILAGHPAAEDASLCLSELATNAMLHSRSREPGGLFTVRALLHGSHLRVEVHDQGGPWLQPKLACTDRQTGAGYSSSTSSQPPGDVPAAPGPAGPCGSRSGPTPAIPGSLA